MTSCIAVVPDCADCERTSRAARNDDHRCDDLCRMMADDLGTDEGHAAFHRARRCRHCGTDHYDENGRSVLAVRPCRYGNCRQWHCPSCDTMWASDGPLGCPCDGTGWFERMRLRVWALWLAVRYRVRVRP